MKQTDASNNRITTIVTILQLNFDKIMLHKAHNDIVLNTMAVIIMVKTRN